jgi:hypothetical protein
LLILLGWFGGAFVGFAAGLGIGWTVSVMSEADVGVFGFAYLGSLVGAVVMVVALPALALFRYRRRSN